MWKLVEFLWDQRDEDEMEWILMQEIEVYLGYVVLNLGILRICQVMYHLDNFL